MNRCFLVLIMSICLCSFAKAQTTSQAKQLQNPLIKGIDIGGSDGRDSHNLAIESLNIDVSIHGNIAQTRIEAKFSNPFDEDVEANFEFQMPKGSIVNGYGLDIEGILIDGVLAAKERAEETYTDKVTDAIDPGIAEGAPNNTFRTRVYPVEEGGYRIIKLEFSTLLSASGYRLPIKISTPIKSLKVSVPLIEENLADITALTAVQAGVYSAGDSAIDFEIYIPGNEVSDHILYARHKSEQSFIGVLLDANELASLVSDDAFTPRNIRIYWDASLSRQNDSLAAERTLIQQWLNRLKPKSVETIIGHSVVTSQDTYIGSNIGTQIRNALTPLSYDGGSNLNALLSQKAAPADLCLLVSDGTATLGGNAMPDLDCPVYIIATAPDANLSYLESLAAKTGGHVVADLSSRSEALATMSERPNAILTSANLEDLKRVGGSNLFIAPLPATPLRSVRLSLRDSSGKSHKIERDLRTATFLEHDGLGTVWANIKAEEMRADTSTSLSDLVSFARPYSLAGPESALLVLEEPSDYVDAELPLPDGFQGEAREDYNTAFAEWQEERAESVADRFDDILTIWEDQIEWWETDFSKGNRKQEKSLAREPSLAAPLAIENNAQQLGADNELDEVVVPAARFAASRTNEEIQIAIRPWSPERPYLKALEAGSIDEFESIYIAQRKLYGDLPAFYFEVADLMHRMGNSGAASNRVLSALELPTANLATQTIVAHRLQTYGDLDRAIELYEEITAASGFRPQPFHNLALALAQRADETTNKNRAFADYMRALEALNHIIQTPWDGDDDGIELISLMDANAIIARMPKRLRSKSPLDKRLVKNLDVDIRVLMDWNIDRADIDLWVLEPSGDNASYSNQLTQTGGQISNDMTDGFGPEQYLIRKSEKGRYTIKTNVFSTDAYNPNGAVGVRTRLYRNFGRKTQSMETVIVEFTGKSNDEKDDYLVGSIDVE